MYPGHTDDIGIEDINNFIRQFKAGALRPYYLSEPEPETQDDVIYELVGRSLKQTIEADESRDVVVFYYRPNNDRCLKLMPTWRALAMDLIAVENLLVARFDASMNEVPGLVFQGFPAIVLYTRGRIEFGLNYADENEVSLESLENWLLANSPAFRLSQLANALQSEEL